MNDSISSSNLWIFDSSIVNLQLPTAYFYFHKRPDLKIPTANHSPRIPAKINPRIPSTGNPYINGPLLAIIISEEPIIRAAITRLNESRLLDLSISVISFERP